MLYAPKPGQVVERLKTPILKIGGHESGPWVQILPCPQLAMLGEWLKPTDCKSVP